MFLSQLAKDRGLPQGKSGAFEGVASAVGDAAKPKKKKKKKKKKKRPAGEAADGAADGAAETDEPREAVRTEPKSDRFSWFTGLFGFVSRSEIDSTRTAEEEEEEESDDEEDGSTLTSGATDVPPPPPPPLEASLLAPSAAAAEGVGSATGLPPPPPPPPGQPTSRIASSVGGSTNGAGDGGRSDGASSTGREGESGAAGLLHIPIDPSAPDAAVAESVTLSANGLTQQQLQQQSAPVATSMSASMPIGWRRFAAVDGRPYFVNPESGATQWEPPVLVRRRPR